MTIMKGVIFPGDKKVEVREFPVPVPGAGEVRVKLKASVICRSDMSLYYGNPVAQNPLVLSLDGDATRPPCCGYAQT
ncbi:hypothetical protein [Cohnella sp. LGH]|uniref:hypothetical protein n=1 Tax=Cohnella sp. LGH TaxID=1619153 RepID=UPI001FFDFE35|nr:hypothetical protein [Cohnella sp. LGH]